ncbi:hypothetical protein FB45DRAFT_896886 [Roridomyces roridus]|uniref:F-box domain-containing protein n=1 Tax=Roridomyces roridus TaxID=1738132 RepID=A0AAD7CAZ5_9AGAR|nr:hypothetical protein FB45DRAFT_896886 [Roridomyces roridus]
MAGDTTFDAMFGEDLKQRAAKLVVEHGISYTEALKKAEEQMRQNNPFIPPAHGCPVNDLPPELLAHIFELGRQMDIEEAYADDFSDDGLDDEDEEWTDEEDGDDDKEVDEVVVEHEEDVRMSSPVKPRARPPIPGSFPGQEDEADDEEEDGDDDAMDDDDDDEDDEDDRPFQELASHVCRHWREIALGTHTLWTRVEFEGHPNMERARAWIDRANGLPLEITVDCTSMHEPGAHDDDPEPEPQEVLLVSYDPTTGTLTSTTHTGPPLPNLEAPPQQPCVPVEGLVAILDMIIPHVEQWRVLEIHVNTYDYMHKVMQRLAACSSAPILEEFGLYTYDDTEEYNVFEPPELATRLVPFHGIVPRLTHVSFWGVHIAWDESTSFLRELRDIELAYHAKDVRPSFETFRAILDASPQLEVLSLCLSGPVGDMETVEVPSLRGLVLCYLESEYAKPLMQALVLPALEELTLAMQDEDFTEFATQLATPARGEARSLLSGLTSLKLKSLPCSNAAAAAFMGQLSGLRRLNLNCSGEDEMMQFFELLQEVAPGQTAPLYCPKLETLRIEGVDGPLVRKLITTRRTAGAPIDDLSISGRDEVTRKDENWFRANLKTFEFFEPSDSEDELVAVDEDDEQD